MFVVGLTGGIGSGKTLISDLFSELGVPVIDADVIARQVVQKGSPVLAEIAARFGKAILLEDGSLNRALLRQKVFASNTEKAWLNGLLHPLIQAETEKQMQSFDAPYLIWSVPLLIENKLTARCDRVLVVEVEPDIQRARASMRDGVTVENIEKIMAAQVDNVTRRLYADDIIENNLPLDENKLNLIAQVENLNKKYTQLALDKKQKEEKLK